jgi:DNA-directed RNA polymerase subunit RPC12/RpoP
MAMVSVNCTSCGGKIQLDNQKESGFCLHCGAKIVFREAIQKVEFVNGPNIDNLMKIAKTAFEDGSNAEAVDYFNKVLEIDADNWEAIYYKGLAKAWKSTLGDICLSDATRGATRALELYITRNNPTQSETYEIRNLFAVEIHKVIVALFNLSVKHYNEFWELENSADEYWERVGHCSLALAYCTSLISDDMVKSSEQIKNNKVAFLKHQVTYMVEKCKWLRYKGDSVWNGSRYVDNYINTWVLDSVRQAAVAQYDECVAEIQKNDLNYQPPVIARTGYTKSGGCYIATAVYGSYEAPEVMVLRKFRDEVLTKSLLGRVFIKTYYVLSPPVANWLKSAKRTNKIVKVLLDNLVNKLQN